MQTVGKDFIEKAFEYARKYAPAGCKLFITTTMNMRIERAILSMIFWQILRVKT